MIEKGRARYASKSKDGISKFLMKSESHKATENAIISPNRSITDSFLFPIRIRLCYNSMKSVHTKIIKTAKDLYLANKIDPYLRVFDILK